MPELSIVICTYRRLGHLEAALRSCLALHGADARQAEIVVVDNSPEGAAAQLVTDLGAGAVIPVRYAHEPRVNISHARNTGIMVSRGDLVAFVDDDMRLLPDWLLHVLDTMRSSGADILFGAVVPILEEGVADSAGAAAFRYFARSFPLADGARVPAGRSGHVPGGATCNVVFRRATCLSTECRFDPVFGRSGGEDTDFIQRVTQRGMVSVWSSGAVAHEIVPAERTTPEYLARRQYQGSHNYARAMIKNHNDGWGTKLMLTTKGAIQVAVSAARLTALSIIHSPAALDARLSLAKAAGKMLWMREARSWW